VAGGSATAGKGAALKGLCVEPAVCVWGGGVPEGCDKCTSSEDVWLEAAGLQVRLTCMGVLLRAPAYPGGGTLCQRAVSISTSSSGTVWLEALRQLQDGHHWGCL
jgi:hypothetical protein